MPQAVNSELLLYADDTCLFFMGKDSKIIGDQLNKDFSSLCEWFIDNKLSFHFGEEKQNQSFLEQNSCYTRENLLILDMETLK